MSKIVTRWTVGQKPKHTTGKKPLDRAFEKMDEFQTIYFKPEFDVNSIDVYMLGELFGVEIALGGGQYLNVYTNDSSVVDSIAHEIRHENIVEIART